MLADFTDKHMGRAWRNRSPRTTHKWVDLARKLGLSDHDAPLLYAICGELCHPSQNFRLAGLNEYDWSQLGGMIEFYQENTPEKAMTWKEYTEYEKQRVRDRRDKWNAMHGRKVSAK